MMVGCQVRVAGIPGDHRGLRAWNSVHGATAQS